MKADGFVPVCNVLFIGIPARRSWLHFCTQVYQRRRVERNHRPGLVQSGGGQLKGQQTHAARFR